ncbi:MAG: hypothetical protein ACFBSE_09590, partial [Prochloraceae cyanobacterium]
PPSYLERSFGLGTPAYAVIMTVVDYRRGVILLRFTSSNFRVALLYLYYNLYQLRMEGAIDQFYSRSILN